MINLIMMKKILILIGLLLTNILAFTQNKHERNPFLNQIYNGKTDFIIGYQYLNYNSIDLGIAREKRIGGWGYSNYHINAEILKNNQNTLIGTKAGFTMTFYLFLNLSANIINYSDFNKNTLTIKPEIGPTLLGFCDINYGYNFFINNNNFEISKHTIAFRVTLGKGVFDY